LLLSYALERGGDIGDENTVCQAEKSASKEERNIGSKHCKIKDRSRKSKDIEKKEKRRAKRKTIPNRR
jgi:hypothetical protein